MGGRLVHFLSVWYNITSDPSVLNIVSGMSIDLIDLPSQERLPHIIHSNSEQTDSANAQISVLLEKRAIIETSLGEPGEFVSNVFLVPKKDGGYRMILNLKRFNHFVEYHHFKMETLSCILQLVQPFCYMATFDLTDAYLTIAINKFHVKFLKFQWAGKTYMYIVLPFGISSAPRKFTKVLKPILAFLRSQGVIILMYIDDGWTMALTYAACYQQISHVMSTFSRFGFLINIKKSRPIPSQRVQSLGFLIDSVRMVVLLPPDKTARVISFCHSMLSAVSFTARQLASFIGVLVSVFPACPLGRLHYRSLERVKNLALGPTFNYDNFCHLNKDAHDDIWWWLHNVVDCFSPIVRDNPSSFMDTDASDYAWGAVSGHLKAQGHFSIAEQSLFIAEKELMAIYFGLQSFLSSFCNTHLLIRCDNTTAVAYIKDMGGMARYLDIWAQRIWNLAVDHNIWISISYISSSDNYHADLASRVLSERTEWSLDSDVFSSLQSRLNICCTIDLFASRLNHKLPTYVSYFPDPGSSMVDAFTFPWNDANHVYYLFPPFCLISRCLQKIIKDRTPLALMVFPLWPNQHWFPSLLRLTLSEILVMDTSSIKLPWQTTPTQHPLKQTLRLSAVKISGMNVLSWKYHQRLRNISTMDLQRTPARVTLASLNHGLNFVCDGKLIRAHLL